MPWAGTTRREWRSRARSRPCANSPPRSGSSSWGGPATSRPRSRRTAPSTATASRSSRHPRWWAWARSPWPPSRASPAPPSPSGSASRSRGRDAFISAGNTGAVMAAATLMLRLHEGVQRAAIGALFPTAVHPVLVLDGGANVDCDARELVGFAHLGSVYVCDGFVGNVVLKFYESAGRMFMGMMKQSFPDVLGRPEATQLFKFLDYSEQGGAPLLGVKGVVIICHGASPARAIKNAVRVAAQMVTSHLDQDIGAELAEGGASR